MNPKMSSHDSKEKTKQKRISDGKNYNANESSDNRKKMKCETRKKSEIPKPKLSTNRVIANLEEVYPSVRTNCSTPPNKVEEGIPDISGISSEPLFSEFHSYLLNQDKEKLDQWSLPRLLRESLPRVPIPSVLGISPELRSLLVAPCVPRLEAKRRAKLRQEKQCASATPSTLPTLISPRPRSPESKRIPLRVPQEKYTIEANADNETSSNKVKYSGNSLPFKAVVSDRMKVKHISPRPVGSAIAGEEIHNYDIGSRQFFTSGGRNRVTEDDRTCLRNNQTDSRRIEYGRRRGQGPFLTEHSSHSTNHRRGALISPPPPTPSPQLNRIGLSRPLDLDEQQPEWLIELNKYSPYDAQRSQHLHRQHLRQPRQVRDHKS